MNNLVEKYLTMGLYAYLSSGHTIQEISTDENTVRCLVLGWFIYRMLRNIPILQLNDEN
jgi:hypothetical protein